METKIYTITDLERDHEKIVEAAEIIRNGGLVAFPTDTVYALGASLESEEAILKLFEVKNRPKENPMNILVSKIWTCISVSILQRLTVSSRQDS